MIFTIKTPESNLSNYNIYINSNFTNNAFIDKLINDIINYNKILVITDNNINPDYYKKLLTLNNSFLLVLNSGETSKSLQTYEKVINYLIDKSFTKKDLIIGFGGGVIGDLCGFVASTYKRGIDYLLVPTTTLSIVDSSIGGKCALNMGNFKNCIGVFTSPKNVYININYLDSLNDENYYNGLMEALKCGLIEDKNLLEIFKTNDKESIKNDIEKVITLSLLVKKKIVEEDYFDKGKRHILNFGHTFGHAIELNLGILHGYSIAIGMLFLCDKSLRNNLIELLNKYIDVNMLIKKIKSIDRVAFINSLINDKKFNSDYIDCVYLVKEGQVIIKQMKLCDLMEAFDEICNW